MAIFILGIGLVSVASLLPAGIVLQQRAEDELMGPIVAADALDLLRARLTTRDFGSWWDFHEAQQQWLIDNGNGDYADTLDDAVDQALEAESNSHPGFWLSRDSWPWQRLAVVTELEDTADPVVPVGTADVFNATQYYGEGESAGEHTLPDGHPWRRFQAFEVTDTEQSAIGLPFDIFHQTLPRVYVTPEERSWPRPDGSARTPRYYWDCALRKTGEEVQAAVFVYRVQRESLSSPPWIPQAVLRDPSDPTSLAPVLHMLDLADPDVPFGVWYPQMQGTENADELPGAGDGDALNLQDPDWSWQRDGQYLLDQYGTIHRVRSGRRRSVDRLALSVEVPMPTVSVQLDVWDGDEDQIRDEPVPFTAGTQLPAISYANMTRSEHFPTGLLRSDVPAVDRLWYLPSEVTTAQGIRYRIIPVYAVVGSL